MKLFKPDFRRKAITLYYNISSTHTYYLLWSYMWKMQSFVVHWSMKIVDVKLKALHVCYTICCNIPKQYTMELFRQTWMNNANQQHEKFSTSINHYITSHHSCPDFPVVLSAAIVSWHFINMYNYIYCYYNYQNTHTKHRQYSRIESTLDTGWQLSGTLATWAACRTLHSRPSPLLYCNLRTKVTTHHFEAYFQSPKIQEGHSPQMISAGGRGHQGQKTICWK